MILSCWLSVNAHYLIFRPADNGIDYPFRGSVSFPCLALLGECQA